MPGDALLIGEGERVPADGVLVAGEVLNVDESALTGESAPASKAPVDITSIRDADKVVPGADVAGGWWRTWAFVRSAAGR